MQMIVLLVGGDKASQARDIKKAKHIAAGMEINDEETD
jgi:putative component of toxin-antitoxin plasmid stabilization module